MRARYPHRMRILVARCTVDYSGRLVAHLPQAVRVIMVKGDGSVLIHSEAGSYKPLNWMSPPCTIRVVSAPAGDVAEEDGDDLVETWTVEAKSGDRLVISVHEVIHDATHDLGVDPGLVKDGVESHLQRLLAEQVAVLGD